MYYFILPMVVFPV